MSFSLLLPVISILYTELVCYFLFTGHGGRWDYGSGPCSKKAKSAEVEIRDEAPAALVVKGAPGPDNTGPEPMKKKRWTASVGVSAAGLRVPLLADPPCLLNFPQLTHLALQQVRISECSPGGLIARCPAPRALADFLQLRLLLRPDQLG